MTGRASGERRGYIYAFAALFLWGIHGPAGRYLALNGVNMFFVTAARFWLGALFFFLYLAFRGLLKDISFSYSLKLVLSISLIGVALNSLLYHLALIYLPGTLVMILENLSPVFVMLMSYMFEDVRPGRKEVVSLLVSLAGIVLIVAGKNSFSDLHPLFVFGVFLGILTGFTFGIYTYLSSVLVRPLKGDTDAISLYLFKIFFITSVMMTPLMFTRGSLPSSTTQWFWLVEMGLLQSGAAYVLWNKALSLLPVNRTSVLFLMTIVFTTINEILFLGLRLNIFLVAGGGLIVLAGYILTARPGATRKGKLTGM